MLSHSNSQTGQASSVAHQWCFGLAKFLDCSKSKLKNRWRIGGNILCAIIKPFDMTTFSKAIREGINNFFSTNGRMSRSAYWWFALFCALVGCGLFIIISASVEITSNTARLLNLFVDITFWYIMIVPGIRRLHDIDKSGSNAFWILLPIVGWIYLIYLYCQPSDPNENYYGDPTK